jgi:hypothetical protein
MSLVASRVSPSTVAAGAGARKKVVGGLKQFKVGRPAPSPRFRRSGVPVPKLKEVAGVKNGELHRVAGMHSNWREGLVVWEEMRQSGIPIQPNSYEVLIKSCLKAKQNSTVLDLFAYYQLHNQQPNQDINNLVKEAEQRLLSSSKKDNQHQQLAFVIETLTKETQAKQTASSKNVGEDAKKEKKKKEKKKKKKSSEEEEDS